ncbi:hypothetical protein BBI11_04225 [Planococcus maritimus]|uniref:hypothetical protein n=1 Tax=Planococcus maritimus TaxID=192421 RepID=UPI00080EFDD4|nr:hypothetical protein [Planococcus maritimus]ANU16310.1 hypothetical protein BBI11_04225 [Planococcus maritimus]
MKDSGFMQDALDLIRSDGHAALATNEKWLRALKMYLEDFRLWLLERSEERIVKEAGETDLRGNRFFQPSSIAIPISFEFIRYDTF